MTEPGRIPEPDIDFPNGAPDGDPHRSDDGAEPLAADDPGPGLPPPTGVESLVGALLEAGPEVWQVRIGKAADNAARAVATCCSH